MLTDVRIRNFKRFENVELPLGEATVLIGPNNSGKTAALQALALWQAGVAKWIGRHGTTESSAKRPGVTVNRLELMAVPVPTAKLLWRDMHVMRSWAAESGERQQEQINIEVDVRGHSGGHTWECGLEFYYANPESFYCRPRASETADERLVPPEAAEVKVAFLPPMSGLAAVETKLEAGRVNVLIGEGQTAQVLRNLCLQLHTGGGWDEVVEDIQRLFGVELMPPRHITERGEITMSYRERGGVELDLACSGRGLQQTLLLLAYMRANPGSVLLLDEPDAHLEILRQRQIYSVITQTASDMGSQVVAASHSEVVLNEAADRDTVVAFVGTPHRIDDRGSQVAKALKSIGFEHYYLAETTGWVLYLEGSTDLAILREFAQRLDHPAAKALERPFVHYIGNHPGQAESHFHGVREAKPDLVGLAIFDDYGGAPASSHPGLSVFQWQRREIESYVCTRETLLGYARAAVPASEAEADGPLFRADESARREEAMCGAIDEVAAAFRTLHGVEPWSPEVKASDDFLNPVFRAYYQSLGLPNRMNKSDYHLLVSHVPVDQIDPEIRDALDRIQSTAESARPTTPDPE